LKKKNVITRALGMSPGLKIDLIIEPIKTGDLFLLCSDGLSNALNDDLLQAIVANYDHNLDVATNNLMANQIDGSDNITVVLAKIVDAGNDQNLLKPVKITLNEENSKISNLEYKYLKRIEKNSQSLLSSRLTRTIILFLVIMIVTLSVLILLLYK